jgi:hypothetical protein
LRHFYHQYRRWLLQLRAASHWYQPKYAA